LQKKHISDFKYKKVVKTVDYPPPNIGHCLLSRKFTTMMVKIDMTGLMSEALRTAGAGKLSALQPEISIQAETKLRICIGERSVQEIGPEEKMRFGYGEGDEIYGGTGKQQEPAGVEVSEVPEPKEEE